MAGPIRVAACHAAPVFLSAKATTQKAISFIKNASKNKANLVIFPETYIPAFPVWSALRAPTHNHDLFKRMASQSIYADGDEIQALQAAAQETKTYLSIGISEKTRFSSGTLFNSNIMIGPDGRVLNLHRKLMPTFFEKLTWAPGDGHGLSAISTPFGNIGALICGENTNPLARYSLIAQAEALHISTWPAAWPTRVSNAGSTPDPGANYDNVAANRIRAAAHCFEAKAFGVLCSGHLDESAIQIIVAGTENAEHITHVLRTSQRGVTMYLDPTGAPIPGFTVDSETGEKREADFLQKEEGILYADLNLADCVEGKQYHDVVGGYQRHDVFQLTVNRERQVPIRFLDPPPAPVERQNHSVEDISSSRC
ncbi:nitrilase [Didymella exigua CBS 183.55]|uniref:Nitrilase n=1 Tax=Didymella exigua CBS 183.55 TaxID=1150837 RepID=A0A6A5RFE9_9PLEO|nr:nitrilase [Didymella exigua CBS 183.55]KAF1927005.1 nitrilase [Didymella exigua CBS 183.55]